MAKTKIGILFSGRGSNMKALVDACADGAVPAEVSLVVSNKAEAGGVEWARRRGLQVTVLPHRDYPDRESHDEAVIEALRGAEVEWVCLAGYMRLLSSTFVAAYRDRILNIHPSLLPAFKGLNAQDQAVAYGVGVSGCTVHLVDDELDHGPIVGQTAVPVEDGDDGESLGARILEQEHRLYPLALARLLCEPWHLEQRRILWGEIERSANRS